MAPNELKSDMHQNDKTLEEASWNGQVKHVEMQQAYSCAGRDLEVQGENLSDLHGPEVKVITVKVTTVHLGGNYQITWNVCKNGEEGLPHTAHLSPFDVW